jgi:hypothetical protein
VLFWLSTLSIIIKTWFCFQIEIENSKNVGANLERITADLRQMKQESASLMAQLKAKS